MAVVWALAVVRIATHGGGRTAVQRGSWALHKVSAAALSALGVRTQVTGRPRSGAALVVGNHVSWLDILVLSSGAPMLQVAKSEIRDWPIISGIGRRTGTIFLDRFRLRGLPDVVDQVARALRQGHKVQGFPEATTRCGGAIGEFHRFLFQAAIDAAVAVAPVTLQYLDSEGRRTTAPAFLGDETLIDSVRRVLALRDLHVRVHWLPAIPAIAGTGKPAVDRARLSTLVERAVARDLGVPVVLRTSRRTMPAAAAPISGPPRRQPDGARNDPARTAAA
jgi:1-acyl-sn-glycerol-3-phosphate acyltransferase